MSEVLERRVAALEDEVRELRQAQRGTRWLSTREAAEYIGISVPTFYRYMKRYPELRACGKQTGDAHTSPWRFDREAVSRWLRER